MPVKMLTRQQIFDRGLAHIRKQGRPSVRPGIMTMTMTCLYRNENGDRCIVGGFISDDRYDPKFDSACPSSVSALVREDEAFGDALVSAGLDVGDYRVLGLLTVMQQAHDVAAHLKLDEIALQQFERGMRQVADSFNLVYTPPEGASA